MKNIFLVTILISVTLQGWTQVNKTDSSGMKSYYIKKSQSQKKTAYILLGAGLTCAAIGGILAANPDPDELIADNSITGGFLLIGGGLSALASIPFFISSSGNKKEAMKLNASVEMKKAMPSGAFKVTYYPALSVKLSLK
jgi:hypothetical protein